MKIVKKFLVTFLLLFAVLLGFGGNNIAYGIGEDDWTSSTGGVSMKGSTRITGSSSTIYGGSHKTTAGSSYAKLTLSGYLYNGDTGQIIDSCYKPRTTTASLFCSTSYDGGALTWAESYHTASYGSTTTVSGKSYDWFPN